MSDAPTEFCYKENRYYPEEEFYDDPYWGRVHKTDRPHTVTGSDLSAGSGEDIGIPMDLPAAEPPD